MVLKGQLMCFYSQNNNPESSYNKIADNIKNNHQINNNNKGSNNNVRQEVKPQSDSKLMTGNQPEPDLSPAIREIILKQSTNQSIKKDQNRNRLSNKKSLLPANNYN